jgi:hypothetical protein
MKRESLEILRGKLKLDIAELENDWLVKYSEDEVKAIGSDMLGARKFVLKALECNKEILNELESELRELDRI